MTDSAYLYQILAEHTAQQQASNNASMQGDAAMDVTMDEVQDKVDAQQVARAVLALFACTSKQGRWTDTDELINGAAFALYSSSKVHPEVMARCMIEQGDDVELAANFTGIPWDTALQIAGEVNERKMWQPEPPDAAALLDEERYARAMDVQQCTDRIAELEAGVAMLRALVPVELLEVED